MGICPFRGIRYSKELIGDLDNVICPPYDIIDREEQEFYYQKSAYNVIRLEYGREECGDDETNNKYTRAAQAMQEWLAGGALERDDTASFYIHDYCFICQGVQRKRRELIARVRLQPWYEGVYPHENTATGPKSDRLKLMQTCRVNFSPIFSLYEDPEKEVTGILAEACHARPLFEFAGAGESHVLWRLTDTELQQRISRFMAARPIYIADGHHRYETALVYQRQRTEDCSSVSGAEPFNYVMMSLVEFSDPGLIVLPVHRLIRGIPAAVLSGMKDKLEQFFTLERFPLPAAGYDTEKLLREWSGLSKEEQTAIGVLGLDEGCFTVLKKRPEISLDDVMPQERSRAYREFDVSLLDHLILDRLLGFVKSEHNITYVADAGELSRRLKAENYQLAFLLSPPRLQVIKDVSQTHDRMPRKSTYFYPKPPTGLVINPLY